MHEILNKTDWLKCHNTNYLQRRKTKHQYFALELNDQDA